MTTLCYGLSCSLYFSVRLALPMALKDERLGTPLVFVEEDFDLHMHASLPLGGTRCCNELECAMKEAEEEKMKTGLRAKGILLQRLAKE
ncbi:hypothetical protein KQX54_021394 [Cotesia glomerata]|uniref:Uncharacterized protein n=1 Tax=Cotesia glomerata TaxID=32391 RepID=A0AAV7JAG3_COTGL|nr:hypothetical protein KQX54_021394 [Cotesia glomerata]